MELHLETESPAPHRITVPLVVTRLGRLEAEVSNEADPIAPLLTKWAMDQESIVVSFSLNTRVKYPRQTLAAARLLKAARDGASIHAEMFRSGERFFSEKIRNVKITAPLEQAIEILGHLVMLEPHAKIVREFELDEFSENDILFLKSFAIACQTGEPVMEGSVHVAGVSAEVLTDEEPPAFTFDRMFKIGGGVLRFVGATIVPVGDGYRRSAKLGSDGKVALDIAPFRVQFEKGTDGGGTASV